VPALPLVQTPTLLLVGADDMPSLHFSQLGADRLYCAHDLQIVPGSSRLDRPSEAASVAQLALAWLQQHLPRVGDARRTTQLAADAT
jgi:putative phosphoribosyl transferase